MMCSICGRDISRTSYAIIGDDIYNCIRCYNRNKSRDVNRSIDILEEDNKEKELLTDLA